MWTDTHCHLTDELIAGGILERAEAAGVGRFICVGTDLTHSIEAIELAAGHPQIFATAGLHPHDASNGARDLADLAKKSKIFAIGECGLDYHYEYSPREAQRVAFSAQIALANELNLPLVIHTREAWDDTFAILSEEGVPARTIFHCFTGGPAEAKRCLQIGALLSFSGIVTFKNASEIREAAAICPLDRMLVETDSPFLAPEPHRGRANEPAFVVIVGQALSVIKGIRPSAVEEATSSNAAKAFGLPRP